MAEIGGKTLMSDVIIEATEVSLAYRRTRHRVSSLKQTAIDTIKRKMQHEEFYALKNVSLQLRKGETLAVIGRNGAGKSTFLKVVARVLPPSTGRIIVRGDVAPMIELGAGFNPELTGAENIVLYGALLGRSVAEMRSRIEPIAEWAGLTEHLDIPVRAYSSGMVARLAFATATDKSPDLLLIDEVLSVGDEEFRDKSSERTQEMMKSGAAVVLVTHDIETVRKMADRVIYLDHGTVKADGDPESVIQAYHDDIHH